MPYKGPTFGPGMSFTYTYDDFLAGNMFGRVTSIDEEETSMPYKKSDELDLKRWEQMFNVAPDRELGKVTNVNATEDGLTVTVTADRITYSPKHLGFEVQRILRNGPATIVFWGDGTKTIVKRPEGKEDDIYEAFTAALGIKMYKTNSHLKKLIKTKTVEAK